jgi:type VI secretion system protein ImpG
MSLHYQSLVHEEALRTLLSVYNFRAYYDQQEELVHKKRLQGIKQTKVTHTTKLLQGSPIRGLRFMIEVLESQFGGEGEVHLFAAVLNEFFSLYSTVNAFHELEVRNVERNTAYKFPAKIGKQQLL